MIRLIPLILVLLGLISAVIDALTPVSHQKGLRRLAASLLISAAFIDGSIAQIVTERRLQPGMFGLCAGMFLTWVGFRKRKRDPDGRSPAAPIL